MLAQSGLLFPGMGTFVSVSPSLFITPLVTSAQVTGEVDVVEFRSENFDNTRALRVWLPPGYHDEENQQATYPVIYLNDGQNLFDAATSTFTTHEWEADETAMDLILREIVPPFIMVGIDHAGRRGRAREYLPYPDEYLEPPEHHPQGKRYGEFLEK